jgi:Methyltransferase domain
VIAILATTILSSPSAVSMSLSSRFQKALAKNFRSPGGTFNVFGWFAASAMKKINVINNHEMIDLMLQDQLPNLDGNNNNKHTTWVELGPGNGMSMEYLLQRLLSEKHSTDNLSIHAFEISERFRKTMQNKFPSETASGLLTIHGEDAKQISAVLQQSSQGLNSVNAIYGTNVVYFLDPLDEYLQAFYEVLQPGGLILFGVQNTAKTFSDTPEFANTDWDQTLEAMKKAGFDDVKQQASKFPGEEEKTFYLMGKKPPVEKLP